MVLLGASTRGASTLGASTIGGAASGSTAGVGFAEGEVDTTSALDGGAIDASPCTA